MSVFHREKLILLAGALAILSMGRITAAPSGLEIVPSVFDFGWAPDNAKISCQFIVKNRSTDMVPLVGVQPTCGCTASQFTPEDLSTDEEAKIGLTFNTRGYAKIKFEKSAKVKTNNEEAEYSVRLKGHVLDPNAPVAPEGDGIAGFEPGSKDKKILIPIQNKSGTDVTLQIVQKPAEWSTVSLERSQLAPGQKTNLEVSVSGSLDETRDTSVTYAAVSQGEIGRFTVAIRTGQPPSPYRRYQPPTVPAATPVKPAEKK